MDCEICDGDGCEFCQGYEPDWEAITADKTDHSEGRGEVEWEAPE